MATARGTKTKQVDNVKESTVAKTTKSPKKGGIRIPLDIEVPCMCNVRGGLIYASSKAGGMSAEWNDFGDLQYLDVRDLLLMRNTQKRFFDDNWISIKDTDDGEYTADDIYKFLRVDDKYGDFYDADNIESFFDLDEDQMKDKVSKMSRGMKDLVSIIALDKIENGEIDSLKRRNEIISALGLENGEDEE